MKGRKKTDNRTIDLSTIAFWRLTPVSGSYYGSGEVLVIQPAHGEKLMIYSQEFQHFGRIKGYFEGRLKEKKEN